MIAGSEELSLIKSPLSASTYQGYHYALNNCISLFYSQQGRFWLEKSGINILEEVDRYLPWCPDQISKKKSHFTQIIKLSGCWMLIGKLFLEGRVHSWNATILWRRDKSQITDGRKSLRIGERLPKHLSACYLYVMLVMLIGFWLIL